MSFQVKLGFETLNGLNDAAVHVHDVAAALDLTEEEVIVPRGNSETGEFQRKANQAIIAIEANLCQVIFQIFFTIFLKCFAFPPRSKDDKAT